MSPLATSANAAMGGDHTQHPHPLVVLRIGPCLHEIHCRAWSCRLISPRGRSRRSSARSRLPLGPKSKVTLLHVVPDDIPGTLRKDALVEAERSLEKALARVHQVAIDRGLSPRQFVADVVEGDERRADPQARAHGGSRRGVHGPPRPLFVGRIAHRLDRAPGGEAGRRAGAAGARPRDAGVPQGVDRGGSHARVREDPARPPGRTPTRSATSRCCTRRRCRTRTTW